MTSVSAHQSLIELGVAKKDTYLRRHGEFMGHLGRRELGGASYIIWDCAGSS